MPMYLSSKKNSFIFFLVTTLFSFTSCLKKVPQTSDVEATHVKNCCPDHVELPAIRDEDVIVRHTGFVLSFNTTYKDANWVAYELTNAELQGQEKRTNHFIPDPDVPGGSATTEDYRNSGYDRGHLVPAADMKWSTDAMHDCFYLSNITPQVHTFNAGSWEHLEEQVRYWATVYGKVFVVTGPIFEGKIKTIGTHHIGVPSHFYKVILECNDNEQKAIGFVMANASSHAPLKQFAVSVDSVESLTGIDFFNGLPDSIENKLEAVEKFNSWPFTVSNGR